MNMIASDHRQIARDALKGKWPVAVLCGFIAVVTGAVSESGVDLNFNLSETESIPLGSIPENLQALLTAVLGFVLGAGVLLALVTTAVRLIVGSTVGIGYRKYLLNLIDGQEAEFHQLFSQFHRLGQAVLLRVLRWLIQMAPLAVVALMTPLLLVELVNLAAFAAIIVIGIFGIYIGYGLEMVEFIMAERETCRAVDALKQSWNLMKGNRWRLFCLEFSFIGWAILTALTLGIGSLWLVPYMQTAYASFYRELNPRTVRTWAVNDACDDDGRFLGGYPELP